jgi:hypothetical protein
VAKLVDVACFVDRAAHDQRRARLRREEVHVGDDADHLAALGEHGKAAHSPIDHCEHQLRAELVGPDRHGWGAHHRADRRVHRPPVRHHSDSEIVVGEDPEPAGGERDDGAAGALIRHAARCLSYRRVGCPCDERLAQELSSRQVGS